MEQDLFEGDEKGNLKAEYADCFRIGHSAHKFVIDFGQIISKTNKRDFHTRIIMDPVSAQDYLEIFKNSIEEYMDQFGTIIQKKS